MRTWLSNNQASAIAVMGMLIRLGITIFLVIIALAHMFGAVALDLIDIVVLAIIAFLWFAPTLAKYIETIEIGGLKVTIYRGLKNVEQEFDKLGLKADPSSSPKPSYLQIAPTDPNLALAGLRIEIEKQLRSLAEERALLADSRNRPPSVSQLMDVLIGSKVLTREETAALNDLIALLNSAVHGAEVSEISAAWAIDVGPQIIAALEQKHLDPSLRYQPPS